MNNTVSLAIGVLILGIIGIIVFSQNADAPTTDTNTELKEYSNSLGESGAMTSPTTSSTSAYSVADVRKHAVASDCWTIINGNVYNLTEWVSKHPGGQRAITQLCGADGSEEFNEQHGGGAQMAAVLVGYQIGTLTR